MPLHRDYIKSFFDEVVDVNSHKLVLAVSAFLDSEWFTMCSEIYARIGQQVIFPLLKLLGVDEKDPEVNEQRTWSGVKDFFETKLELLKDLKTAKLDGEPAYATLLPHKLHTVLSFNNLPFSSLRKPPNFHTSLEAFAGGNNSISL